MSKANAKLMFSSNKEVKDEPMLQTMGNEEQEAVAQKHQIMFGPNIHTGQKMLKKESPTPGDGVNEINDTKTDLGRQRLDTKHSVSVSKGNKTNNILDTL